MDDFEMLRNADISACDAAQAVDLRNISVSRKKPAGERTDDFIRQVGNPYLFRVGSTVVKVEFGNGKDFSQMLADIMLSG